MVTSKRVRRPKRRKSAVKRKVKGIKKTSKTKVKRKVTKRKVKTEGDIPPPKVDTPVIRAEKALAPGKARKRKTLKKARARPRKQDYEDNGFQMIYVESSNLLAVGYKPSRRIMRIAFIGGNVYDYFGIPPYVFTTLLRASSHGKYLHWSIKIHTPQFDGHIYKYEKVR